MFKLSEKMSLTFLHYEQKFNFNGITYNCEFDNADLLYIANSLMDIFSSGATNYVESENISLQLFNDLCQLVSCCYSLMELNEFVEKFKYLCLYFIIYYGYCPTCCGHGLDDTSNNICPVCHGDTIHGMPTEI